MNTVHISPASFRDPSGFVFRHGGKLYRQVNDCYRDHYLRLMDSGLYERLVDHKLLIHHEEVAEPVADPATACRILRPQAVEMISYPYEWCFSQLKDAALMTLEIQRTALEFDMTLKDASAYNVQFREGRPVLIDTLSFETYTEGRPWAAYRQFCQHFLAPLALMACTDIRLGQLLRFHLDGVPLDLASRLLPVSTRVRPGLLMHLHLHARSQKAFSRSDRTSSGMVSRLGRVSRTGLRGLVDGLRKTVGNLDWKPAGTEWVDYYRDTNYSDAAFAQKQVLLGAWLRLVHPDRVWDLGANTGVFSRIAAAQDIPTVAFDLDPAAVERNYRQVRSQDERRLLPLLLDLTNPSPGQGWAGAERDSLIDRGPVDCVLALALIHHLAIANNLPLNRLADFFDGICRHLIIEFVPKQDSQVQRLLRSREDIFTSYDRAHFEQAFGQHFSIRRQEEIAGSERSLYLMEKR